MTYPSYRLEMRTGSTPGATFDLSGEEVVIGREPANTITINDPEISRRHARLIFQSGNYLLEDLGSTNGTFVDGTRLIGLHLLRVGEVISFGQSASFVFNLMPTDQQATMVGPASALPVSRPPVSSPVTPPVQQQPIASSAPPQGLPPAPPPIYPRSVPQVQVEAQPVEEEDQRQYFDSRWALAGCGVLAVIACLVLIAFLFWVDSGGADRWCQFFGFVLPACP